MNKNDMLKAAKRLDDMGVDPDLVMLQSVEEYSESYDDEVDTYDEDKKDIRDTEIKVEELS